MSSYSNFISNLEYQVNKRDETLKELEEKSKTLREMEVKLANMFEASSLLATVSDDTTTSVLDFITGVINKALAEIFPYDTRRVYLEKKLHAGTHPHIVVILETGDGHKRNLTLQSGTGIRQIVSFLFTISLIEIRKGRRLLIMDELLSGVHEEAKKIILDIVQIFAGEGFQFVMVEYGVNDTGKMYLVEKPGKTATLTPLDCAYDNQVFLFNKPEDLDIVPEPVTFQG